MGAFASYAAFKAACERPEFRLPASKVGFSGSGSSCFRSRWTAAPNAGAVPGLAVACDASTVGALPGLVSRAASLYPVSIDLVSAIATNNFPNFGLLIDRLSHQGGLGGTATGEQTTNLPTAALPRYTSGEGLMAAIEIYATIGGGQTATLRYTNQAGIGGRASQAIDLNSNVVVPSALNIFSLQDGDTGIRSIEGVTLSASTGTAGNFGVTIFKPLLLFPWAMINRQGRGLVNMLLGGGLCLPEIDDAACLQVVPFCSTANENAWMAAVNLGAA